MVPINVSSTNSAHVVASQAAAIPIRHKRAETALYILDGHESSPLSPNSIMSPPIKKTRLRKSVQYGTVEALDYETHTDASDDESLVPDVWSDWQTNHLLLIIAYYKPFIYSLYPLSYVLAKSQ